MIGPSGKKMEGFGNSHSQPASRYCTLYSVALISSSNRVIDACRSLPSTKEVHCATLVS